MKNITTDIVAIMEQNKSHIEEVAGKPYNDDYIQEESNKAKSKAKEQLEQLKRKQFSRLDEKIEREQQKVKDYYSIEDKEAELVATTKAEQELKMLDDVTDIGQHLENIKDPIKRDNFIRLAKVKLRKSDNDMSYFDERIKETRPDRVAEHHKSINSYQRKKEAFRHLENVAKKKVEKGVADKKELLQIAVAYQD